MNNTQIAGVFEDIAFLLEMAGEKVFQIRAYQRAARTISHLPTELEQMVVEEKDLTEIPGIGKAISDKIKEMVETDELEYFGRLKEKFPGLSLELLKVPGLGPKTVVRLYEELGITSVADLEEGIENGAVATLPRLGKKTADNILRQIQASRTKDQRIPIGRAMRAAERVIGALKKECPNLIRIASGGSLRRFEETIGDIDIVCTSDNPQEVLDALVAQPNVREVLGHGGTKASVILNEGMQVDLRVVEDRYYGHCSSTSPVICSTISSFESGRSGWACPSTSTASPTLKPVSWRSTPTRSHSTHGSGWTLRPRNYVRACTRLRQRRTIRFLTW